LLRLIEMFRRPDRVTIAELVNVFLGQVWTPPVGDHRAIQHVGRIISAPVLGGLHHHYCRI